MQTLDIHRPEMPDLQFVLLVTALCTSRLSSLNVPEDLRVTMFNRCWTLIHDSPPPGRREERVLDLRLWNEVTLEAMVETIRGVLTGASIQTLAWDHPPSEPTCTSTPEAQVLIDRIERLYPHSSEAGDAASREVLEDTGAGRDEQGTEVRQLVGEMAALMASVAPALKRRAAALAAEGKAGELPGKLLEGADILHDSGHLYLNWARHYAALADDNPQAGDDKDDSEPADR